MKQSLIVTIIIAVIEKSVKPLFNYQGALLFVDKTIIYPKYSDINWQYTQCLGHIIVGYNYI